MFAEPEAADRSERRMSERPPRQEAEGVRAAAGGEGTLRLRWKKIIDAERFGTGKKLMKPTRQQCDIIPCISEVAGGTGTNINQLRWRAVCRAKG